MANPNPKQENLTPFTKGYDPHRQVGRPLGAKNWATIVQELLEDENLAQKMLEGMKGKGAPAYLNALKRKDGASIITTAMIVRAMNGDHRAADWLRKTGFGDKIDVDVKGKIEGLSDEQLAAIVATGVNATSNGSD